MKYSILSLYVLLANFTFYSQSNILKDYQRILTTYVDNYGRVNYKQLSENETTKLSQIINKMCLDSPREKTGNFKAKEKSLAFWINLYNAIVLSEVANHYPIKSIQNIRNVWKKKHRIAGLEISLDEIEHNYIRNFNDPRSHFAIICAAFSCPKLQRFVFSDDQLEKQFVLIEKEFYSNPINFEIDSDNSLIKISELFFWYINDFTAGSEETRSITEMDQKALILKYLRSNTPESIRNQLNSKKHFEIVKMPWHWQLNESKL